MVLIGCARRFPRAWPAVAGTLLGCLVMVGSFVYPVLVEPAFNSFTPLQDGPLRTQILQLADTEHVHLDDVLVANASRRTTTLNAYVSGFGSTRRVVLYDNVIHDLPRAQILSIVAHELGHARHDDVLTGSVLAALGHDARDRAARARPPAGRGGAGEDARPDRRPCSSWRWSRSRRCCPARSTTGCRA